MYGNLALLAAFLLLYSLVANAVERTWISGPIIFTAFGLLIGPVGLDLLTLDIDGEVIGNLAEATLALVLFTDAAKANVNVLKQSRKLPTRLLLIGLPLTILLGFGTAALLLENQPLLVLALLATMLAPTDAALGKAVVTNPVVPEDIRESLNVESGLNDGICVPVLLVFLELALGHLGEQRPWTLTLSLVLEEIGIGLMVGLTVTFLAFKLLTLGQHRDWLNRAWMQLPVAAIALVCYALAQYLGGSGFIAAFCGGLLAAVMGPQLKSQLKEEVLEASEGVGNALALITWVFFGSAVVGQIVDHLNWLIILYSVLSLTIIRMLPVYLSLMGSGMDTEGKLFIGWFGPRGLASIVFAVMIINSGLPDSGPLVTVVACTVILSILAHGMTANVWARAYGNRRNHGRDEVAASVPRPD